ncbi:restriction endonuclease [Rubrivirga sp.]|uniref:restriction endonuclease n=1 Tax=Rubrivirga sp. TaxID=1885344 RepID=UPI003B51D0AD
MTKQRVPRYSEMMNPLLAALRDLGGSGSISEINETAAGHLDLPDDVLEILHNPEKSNQTEVEYRLAWARTYLKKYGVLDNSNRGIWVIRPEKRDVEQVDSDEVVRFVRELSRREREEREAEEPEEASEDAPEEAKTWRALLHRVLTQELSPDGFERLTKRLLRESGFVQVEVTGRSGDGGVDGKGILRIGGLLSFHVVFQCKRYQGSVTSPHIRDFRGAMVGRADKGLFITTGHFTRDAVREATRDGAPPIDLIDGDLLADKLKELRLGVEVETEVVERVRVNNEWFRFI